jgi:hypothetical protein
LSRRDLPPGVIKQLEQFKKLLGATHLPPVAARLSRPVRPPKRCPTQVFLEHEEPGGAQKLLVLRRLDAEGVVAGGGSSTTGPGLAARVKRTRAVPPSGNATCLELASFAISVRW